MPHRTLDEYLKQTTPTTTKQQATKPKYRITGFYKETELQETLIGRISKEWQVLRLRELFTYIKGKKPKNLIKEEKEGYLPYLTTDYLRTGVPSNYAKHEKDTIIVNDNDILLLWDGSNAGEFFLGKKGILASTMVKLVPKINEISTLFYFYYLKLVENHLKSLTKGTGIPHVEKSVFENLQLIKPPLEEQWGIAEVLSSVDEAIEATERLIGRLERLKRGLMQELLTRGIGHREYKQTPIGKIPKEWKIVRLGEVADLFQYGLSVKMYDAGKYPIVKMDSIINGEVKPINIKYVNIDEETFRKYKLEKGDILINRTNSYELVGRTGIFLLNGDYVFASYLIRIRPRKQLVNPRFLTYYLIFSNDRLRQIATRAVSQANINATNLKKFKIALPPLKEQEIITNILLSYDEWIKLEKKRREKLERLKRGLMELLLTGRVRVRVERLDDEGNLPGSGGGAGS